MTTDQQLKLLNRLVGKWTTEATHPAVPGTIVHGTTTFEWLDGERFLICRSDTDHPQFPGAISIIGDMSEDRIPGGEKMAATNNEASLRMHYFDTRGVFRENETSIDASAWQWRRDAPGFSQQFTGTFADGGDTIVGKSMLRRDDVHWADDLQITYRRQR
jgi:hypothetical protein